MFNLSWTLTAFFVTFYFAHLIGWPWPLYVLYALFFMQFTLALTRGRRGETSRLSVWLLGFLAGFGVIFHVLQTWGPLFFVSAIREIPDQAQRQPWVFWPLLLALLTLIFLPLYFRWKRLFGWVNAYRIVTLTVLSLSMAVFFCLRGMAWANTHLELPGLQPELDNFIRNTKPKYDMIFGLLAISSLRLFFFEIFVFAAVRGYAMARRYKPEVSHRQLSKETGLVRSAFALAQVLRQFVLALENMVHYLIATMKELGVDLARVVLAFLREILIPTVVLSSAALLIYWLSHLTVAYANAPQELEIQVRLRQVVMIMAGIVATVLCEMIFLGCKTNYRWSRITAFHGQFIGWLLPNLIVFFLLLSLSLWGSTAILNSDDPEKPHLPFYIGLLTKGFAALLVILVSVILWRKRSLLFTAPAESAHDGDEATPEIVEEHAEAMVLEQLEREQRAESQAAAQPALAAASGYAAPPAVSPAALKKRQGRGWDIRKGRGGEESSGSQSGDLLSSARAALDKLPFRDKAEEAFKGFSDKVAGRPEMVTRLLELRVKIREKGDQLDALEKTRGTISRETYEPLFKQYTDELAILQKGAAELQAKADAEYGEQMVEKTRLEALLAHLEGKLNEVKNLRQAGAIEQKDYDKRSGLLHFEIDKGKADLRRAQKKLEFLGEVVRKPDR
jgi:hypothetical protein